MSDETLQRRQTMTLTSRLTAAFAVVLALLVVFAAAPAEGQPRITVTPDVVRSGDLFVVRGEGFRRRSTILAAIGTYTADVRPEERLTIDCNRPGTLFAEVLPSTDGYFEHEARYQIAGGQPNEICEVQAVQIGGIGGEAPLRAAARLIVLAPRPTLRIVDRANLPMVIADGASINTMYVRALAHEFGTGVGVGGDQPRLCGLRGLTSTTVPGPSIGGSESNHYHRWLMTTAFRIKPDDPGVQDLSEHSIATNYPRIGRERGIICTFTTGAFGAEWDVAFVAVDDDTAEEIQRDKEAIERFYRGYGGQQWTVNTNWNTDRPLSEWHGITADEQGRVTGIRLPDNNSRGDIGQAAETLGTLPDLTALDLRGNNLTGEIPRELARFADTINPQQGGVNLPVEGTNEPPPPPPPGDLEIELWSRATAIIEGEWEDLTARANRAVSADTTVRLEVIDDGSSVSSSDYSIDPNPITINAGETTGTARVTVREDHEVEPDEAMIIEGRYGGRTTTNTWRFGIWDAAVPALPFLGALLLAAGLCVMGLRKVREGRG